MSEENNICFPAKVKYKKMEGNTAWKLSKYEVFSAPYFGVFGLNTDICSSIWTEFRYLWRKSLYAVKIQENTDQKKSVFGHFSRGEKVGEHLSFVSTVASLFEIF